jgi:hypothetical protein
VLDCQKMREVYEKFHVVSRENNTTWKKFAQRKRLRSVFRRFGTDLFLDYAIDLVGILGERKGLRLLVGVPQGVERSLEM